MAEDTPNANDRTATAAELVAAADVLAQVLPGRFNQPARLVRTTRPALDAVAFCRRSHPPGEADLGCCEVIDCFDTRVASLLVALLNGRHGQAACLRGYAKVVDGLDAPAQGPVAEVVHAVFGAQGVATRG